MDKIYDLLVCPENTTKEELDKFVEIGQELNLSGLCFCFKGESIKEADNMKSIVETMKRSKKTKMEIFFGIIISEAKKEKMIQKINLFRNMADIIAVKALNSPMQRAICENKKTDLLIRNYVVAPESHKEGYFDKIMTDLCKKNNVANTILFSDLITFYKTKRANYIKFVKSDLMLFNKRKAPFVVVSAAKTPSELRDAYSLLSIVKIFEKDNEYRKTIGNNSVNIIEKIKAKMSENYISEGINTKNI
ncbi:MAG: hypothetical protein KAR87_03220 [Candidatus Aenigmarchaeota archaeon]|nr:hypothetical protein [Candidatus Aenigmarchaeota archaeon]